LKEVYDLQTDVRQKHMNSLVIILITIVVTALLLEAAGWRVPRGARIRRERDEFIAFPYYYEAPSVGKVTLLRGVIIAAFTIVIAAIERTYL
jgi:hypothetical protein